MKTHYYDGFEDIEDIEIAPCGTRLGEEYLVSRSWIDVTCSKCIKSRAKFEFRISNENDMMLDQMQSFVDFCRDEKIISTFCHSKLDPIHSLG